MENTNNNFTEEQELLDKKLADAIQKGEFNSLKYLIECGGRIDSHIVRNIFEIRSRVAVETSQYISKLHSSIKELQNLIEKNTENNQNKELLEKIIEIRELIDKSNLQPENHNHVYSNGFFSQKLNISRDFISHSL